MQIQRTQLDDSQYEVSFEFEHYKPLPSQLRFHRLISKHKGFSSPVGGGKTRALCYEAIKLAYVNGGCLGLMASSTYRMTQDVVLRMFLDILEAEKIDYTERKADWKIHLHDRNSDIIFRSMDDETRLVGTNLAWFCVDELTYCPDKSWQRLEARLREPKANRLCGAAVFTPKGFDPVYRRFVDPKRSAFMKRNYQCVLANPGENVYVLDKNPEFYETLKHSYDEKFYAQEALGKFLPSFGGQVYYAFHSEDNVRPLSFDRRYPICVSWDFNVNPLCLVIAQLIPTDMRGGKKKIHVLDEIVLPSANTMTACEEMIERLGKYAPDFHRLSVQIYGDPSGHSHQTSATQTDWEIIRNMLARHTEFAATFHVPEYHGPVKERITATNSMLKAASGEHRLFVDPKCKELILDFEQVSWKQDAHGNTTTLLDKRDPQRTHISDALSYLCVIEFALLRDDYGLQSSYVF